MPYRVLLSVTLGLILFAAGTARSQSYLVSHFGAIADDGVDDTKAVVRALATLPEGSTLQFASGRYDFRSHDSRGHLNFIDMRHRHLRGATTGARTVFSFYDRTRPGVLMQRAADCSIEHVDLEYTQRPFTQGTIVATSSAGLFVDVQIAEGYPVPEVSRDTLLWSRAESLIAYEPLTRQIKTGGEQIRLRATNPVTRVSSTVLRMHFANATPLGPTEFNVQSGDLFALKCNLATIIVLRDSSQVVLRQLTITNSGSAAVASTYDDGAVMEFLDVVPAGDALLSVNRCGLHFKESRSGPIVRDSRFERTGDDAIAIASSWLEVLAVLAPRTVILGTKNNYVIEPRSHLRFQDGTNFSVLDECQTSGSTYLGYDPTIQRHRYQVELSFPTSAVAGDLAVRSDLLAVGFCIERNVIRDHRARGILVKGSHGQILDNDIDGSTLGGIVLGPEIDVFLEASFVEDVVIARNRIANVGLGRRPHISQSGAIVVTVRTPPSSGGGIDAVTRQNRRIVIQENTVRHSAYCGLLLVAAENISVIGNDFASCQISPFSNGSGLNIGFTATPLSTIHIQNCGGVQLLGNRVEAGLAGFGFASASSQFVEAGNRSISYTGFESYETDMPWPDASSNGGSLHGHNPQWTQLHDNETFEMQLWGIYSNLQYPYFIDRQCLRSEHGGGSLQVTMTNPSAIEFDLGSNSLSGAWNLVVDIFPIGLPALAVTLGNYSNTPLDLDGTAPAPYWSRRRLDLGPLLGDFVLRFRRIDSHHGSPYLYLDELTVEH